MVYNENNDKPKQLTPLPVKNSVLQKMLLALKVKQEIEIKNAFIAFADDILYQRVKPTYDALSYFLAEEEGQFNTKKETLRFIKKLNNNGIESNLIKNNCTEVSESEHQKNR